MVGAPRQQPVEQNLVEALGRRQRIGDPLQRILIEVEARGAERQVEIGDDHVALERAGDGERRVVADRARAGAALGADKGDDLADRSGLRIGVDRRDALDDLRHVHRRHDIFADAAAQELAVEQHVVDVTDGDDLGARIADLGKALEIGEHRRPVEQGLDDDQVRRRGVRGRRRRPPPRRPSAP